MSRDAAIAGAQVYFDDGGFLADLKRRVAIPSESQRPERRPILQTYFDEAAIPQLRDLGFATRTVDGPEGSGPFLIGERHEGDGLPTVLIYGHGDVVRGYEGKWRDNLSPWEVTVVGDRWYGRGTADNKGQHAINLAALAPVMAARGGRLGFNVKLILEMGEEIGSPGLREVCARHKAELKADVLIASDGPRMSAARPTVFLGSRGAFNFDLVLKLRDGGHHSGNWGGALRNPATILAAAIASMVDANGKILVEGLRPQPIPAAVRAAIADLKVGGNPGDPEVDADWGEPGLTTEERVYGWNTLEVLAMLAGNPDLPVNAIPPEARATLQLRYVVGCDPDTFIPAISAHLAERGFGGIVATASRVAFAATRLDPENPWVTWALASIARTSGKKPALLPNLGGSLPNDAFADVLGLPTIWVPHSYPACSQHAPDEHLLGSVAREALGIMAGLYWDLGEDGKALIAAGKAS
ncbi:conserved hypothetical protein [uncultured Alphaproteobacteria bacterium]|uniref:Peptidase M20 dimerisation domain-containing protein n=1 Tax=uncultured Alphaproteobacteria bacterium TaxID=91750 RepID=A0A212K3S4_9PROT|nr:conserved hypothetical protein [uncultured Alphaproteobacteria bacterium]